LDAEDLPDPIAPAVVVGPDALVVRPPRVGVDHAELAERRDPAELVPSSLRLGKDLVPEERGRVHLPVPLEAELGEPPGKGLADEALRSPAPVEQLRGNSPEEVDEIGVEERM